MKNNSAFTLIELLVVIAIIGVLASLILASLNDARIKARNARRISDMHQIVLALNLFYDKHGCLPIVTGSTCPGAGSYNDSNAGAWDYSSQGGFMGFLQTDGEIPSVPVDPLNNMTGDNSPSDTYAYRYFCYFWSNLKGVHLGYWTEPDHNYVLALGNPSTWTDDSYTCQ